MKRKASQEFSKEGTGGVAEEGEGRQVASSVTEIDPSGDLQMDFMVRIGPWVIPNYEYVDLSEDVAHPNDNDGELHGLLVNKHTLRLSSPVFRTLLADDSPFLESGGKTTNWNGKQVIQFEDDDLEAMKIVMNAIHLQHHRIPMRINIALFEQIAIVCDKYDIRCLSPWAESWSKDHLHQDCSSVPRPLFIAWVFKLADWFVRLTKDLILETASSSKGELLREYSSHFRESVPQSVVDRIAERRTEVVSQLLELCWQRSRKLRYTPEVCGIIEEPEHERRNCDLINLGSLTREFPDLSGSPLDDDGLASPSAVDVLASIRKMIETRRTWPSDHHLSVAHNRCCIGHSLNSQAERIINLVDGIELEAIAPGAPPLQPEDIAPFFDYLEKLNDNFEFPQFELVLRFTAIPDSTNFWQAVAVPSPTTSDTRFAWCPRFKCIYCPGFEYSLFQHECYDREGRKALYSHLFNPTHIERFRRTKPGRSDLTGVNAALAISSPSIEGETVVRDFGWLGNYPPAP